MQNAIRLVCCGVDGDLMVLPNREVLYKIARILGGEEAVSIVKILENVDEITDEEIVQRQR